MNTNCNYKCFHVFLGCKKSSRSVNYKRAYRKVDRIIYFFIDILTNVVIAGFFILHFLIGIFKYIISGYPNHISDRLPYPAWYVRTDDIPSIVQAFIDNNPFFSLEFSYTNRLPYDSTTPIGYFTTIILQALIFIGSTVSARTVFVMFYSFCQVLIAFARDLSQELNELNSDILAESEPFSIACSARFKKKLCNIIQFHADAKRFVDFGTRSERYSLTLHSFFI